MEIEDWDAAQSGGSSDSDVASPDSDNEDPCYAYGDIPNLQFRKEGSKARWNEELGMAEIVSNKGRMWTTTGIVCGGKIYSFLEDTLFLAEIGALQLLDDDDRCIPLEDIYKKVAKGVGGSSWESFEVYRHLKSLGYIIKRHGVCWIMKRAKNAPASVEGQSENGDKDKFSLTEITELFSSMQINEVNLVFDVYPPNSKFRKSCPGKPMFVLCINRVGFPPFYRVRWAEAFVCISFFIYILFAVGYAHFPKKKKPRREARSGKADRFSYARRVAVRQQGNRFRILKDNVITFL